MKSSSSRRQFITRSAVIGAAAGIGLPKLAMADTVNGISIGQIPQATAHAPTDRVNIASNENPLGPSAAALKAIAEVAPSGGRYGYNLTVELAEEIVKQNGLPSLDYVAIYPGSTAPLDLTVIGFTGPDKSLVTALPSYEQGWRTAAANGAKVIKILQRKDYSHDVEGMCAADPNAGIIYICNPNNPTGSVTTRKDIEYALANKPKGSVLVLDEAYIDFAETASSGMDLVAKGEDVIVLRTFSKLYGMAGIRLGYVAARPDLLKKIKTFNIGQIPVTAIVAGLASLRDPNLVPSRRAETKAVREDVIAWLNKKGYPTSATESNCFMVDTKLPVKEFMEAMASHGVMVGRGWDGFPTESRITVGTPLEMARFKEAFALVEAGKRGNFPPLDARRLASDLRGDYIDGVMLA